MRALLCCGLLAWSLVATADESTLAPYLDDQSFLIARLDLAAATDETTIAPLLTVVETLGQAAAPNRNVSPGAATREAIGVLRELHAAGASELRLVFAIDDVRPAFGPLMLVVFDEESRTEAAAALLRDRLAPLRIEVRDAGDSLRVGSAPTLDRYEHLQPKARPDLLEPLDRKTPLSLVFSPGADSRRVIRELWPDLPPELASVEGRLIAEGMRHVGFTLTAGEQVGAELRVQAANEPAAEQFVRAIGEAYAAGVATVRDWRPEFASIAEQATELLRPEREGDAVVIRLRAGDPAGGQLAMRVLAPAIAEASELSRRSAKMNDMKQIALALLNYESANGYLPGPIVSEEGKPLLSWRVAILPYLEQSALFREFHLDEPWDSPHNLEWAKALPQVYFENSGLPEQQRTDYLRPVYPGSDVASAAGESDPVQKRSHGQKYFVRPGDKYRQITDGASNTILLAEVAPEHAISWTKPGDWEVDLKDPMAKLRTDQRKGFVSARYDGSAHYLTFDFSTSGLKKLITKAGGEVLSQDERP
ncbi:hypothetical protein MalM25_06300 [Planctomycetes bacterium MalM25]|nr:hypothetical protein MalM25_06300 [Planctomycetes bacterium MalM25]